MSGVQIEEKVEKICQVLENYLEDLRGKFTVISKDKVRIRDQE